MAEATKDTVPISVVVVDDDILICNMITRQLKHANFIVRSFTDTDECLKSLKADPADIVIADLRMPKLDGFGILKIIKKEHPSTDVIIVTGYAEKSIALEALRLGAFDLVEKPFNSIELTETVKRTMRYQMLVKEKHVMAEQISELSKREAERWGIKAFIGKSPAMKHIINDIRLLQKTESTSVLITGESGTGKELVARAIHFGSVKAAGPFVPVNCAAIPKDLAESILFGHIKGSFTGASSDRKGAFQDANGGSIFLDEIGEMPLELQTKLLRVLEDGIVVPVGKSGGQKVIVRTITATNANLKEEISTKRFREDLFYRISAYTINIPPLRERKEDIVPLLEHYAEVYRSEMSLPPVDISADAKEFLVKYPFPGNIRELKNLVEHALIASGGKTLEAAHFHIPISNTAGNADLGQASSVQELPTNLKDAEMFLINRVLQQTNGNISAAASLLGITRARLYRKISSRKK